VDPVRVVFDRDQTHFQMFFQTIIIIEDPVVKVLSPNVIRQMLDRALFGQIGR
jgi:hypothetical protein